jgi:hypothetical protein
MWCMFYKTLFFFLWSYEILCFPFLLVDHNVLYILFFMMPCEIVNINSCFKYLEIGGPFKSILFIEKFDYEPYHKYALLLPYIYHHFFVA